MIQLLKCKPTKCTKFVIITVIYNIMVRLYNCSLYNCALPDDGPVRPEVCRILRTLKTYFNYNQLCAFCRFALYQFLTHDLKVKHYSSKIPLQIGYFLESGVVLTVIV
jgi:hypothetical protein